LERVRHVPTVAVVAAWIISAIAILIVVVIAVRWEMANRRGRD